MAKFFLWVLALTYQVHLHAQTTIPDTLKPVVNAFTVEQKRFIAEAPTYLPDALLQKYAIGFAKNTMDSMLQVIMRHDTVSMYNKYRSIESMNLFLKNIRGALYQNTLNEYYIQSAFAAYSQVLAAVVTRRSFVPYFKPLGLQRSKVVANAFKRFNRGAAMSQMVTLKTLAQKPENILPFLTKNPQFYYTDSLLFLACSHIPIQVLRYTAAYKNAVTASLQRHPHPAVQALLAMQNVPNLSEVAPFAATVANGTQTVATITETRKNIHAYFQLLVNTSNQNFIRKLSGLSAPFRTAIETALQEKAIQFYVAEINFKHDLPDKVRFASVANLRPIDVYYIIIQAEDELYTSSYLGLFKILLAKLPKGQAQTIFTDVQYHHFRKFMRMAGQYNTLHQFLQEMPPTQTEELLQRFVANIDKNPDDATEEAMNIADAFVSLHAQANYNNYLVAALQTQLAESKQQNRFLAHKLYGVLSELLSSLDTTYRGKSLYSKYKTLSIKNNQDTVYQWVFFYGDKDGVFSYKTFLQTFDASWAIDTSASPWLRIVSKASAGKVVIFANKPLNTEEELDKAAIRKLATYLAQQNIRPSIIVHRGHSYHLPFTLQYLTPTLQLGILGSCGSYQHINQVAATSKTAHIIATRQTGTASVNNPLLRIINQHLQQNKPLYWPGIWQQLQQAVKGNNYAQMLLQDYIPPYLNFGLFVAKELDPTYNSTE